MTRHHFGHLRVPYYFPPTHISSVYTVPDKVRGSWIDVYSKSIVRVLFTIVNTNKRIILLTQYPIYDYHTVLEC